MAEKRKEKEVKVSKAPEQELQPAGRRGGLMEPFDEFDRLFDSFFRRGLMRSPLFDWPELPRLATLEERMPRVDIVDRDKELVVHAELPGVTKDGLEVTLGEDTLTIRGSRKHEQKESGENYYRSEIHRGEFCRTLRLPAVVDGDKAKAKFSDGVLELTLPKVESARRRTVKVE